LVTILNLNHEQVAAVMDLNPKTLRKHYCDALHKAKLEVDIAVGETILAKCLGGVGKDRTGSGPTVTCSSSTPSLSSAGARRRLLCWAASSPSSSGRILRTSDGHGPSDSRAASPIVTDLGGENSPGRGKKTVGTNRAAGDGDNSLHPVSWGARAAALVGRRKPGVNERLESARDEAPVRAFEPARDATGRSSSTAAGLRVAVADGTRVAGYATMSHEELAALP
jgi:hypothetical protein